MKTRKPYQPPAINEEDRLERTSLACNVTTEPQPGAFTLDCRSPIETKGGAFNDESCIDYVPDDPKTPIPIS